MRDLREDWQTIVLALAKVELSRAFARPLIILAHEPPASNPPGTKTQDRQKTAVKAMLTQADMATKAYTSGHHAPLLWQVRVDKGRVLGLVFLQLELKLEMHEGGKRARIRLVSSKRHRAEGWSLETEGCVDAWAGAQRILAAGNCPQPKRTDRTYHQVDEALVPGIIDAIIREADRLHLLLEQAFNA